MAACEFRLTEDHLKLLRRANVKWQADEYGAPEIDPKRPYGNGDVEGDVIKILGWAPADPDRPEWPALRPKAASVHRETATALQIVLRFAGLAVEPGLYRQQREYDYRSWEKVGD